MWFKKNIILFSSLLFYLSVIAQEECSIYPGKFCENRLNTARINTYKSIILSKELESDKKCHIVTIQPVSLSIKYNHNLKKYDVKEFLDTISVDSLRKQLPKPYWIYPVKDQLTNTDYGEGYIHYFEKSDSIYTLKYSRNDICDFSYDIIKIYEPFDKWAGVYRANFEISPSKVVIPVKYEYLNNVSINEKYLFYEIRLDSGGGVESVKVTETK